MANAVLPRLRQTFREQLADSLRNPLPEFTRRRGRGATAPGSILSRGSCRPDGPGTGTPGTRAPGLARDRRLSGSAGAGCGLEAPASAGLRRRGDAAGRGRAAQRAQRGFSALAREASARERRRNVQHLAGAGRGRIADSARPQATADVDAGRISRRVANRNGSADGLGVVAERRDGTLTTTTFRAVRTSRNASAPSPD